MATKILILMSMLAVTGTAKLRDDKLQANTSPEPFIDTTKNVVVTITKVRKPWYAWHGLVVKKMIESIPEYRGIAGLNEKYYSFTSGNKYFGGIYFWSTPEDAKNWFNDAWFERTKKKYGEPGIVEYYQIEKTEILSSVSADSKNMYAILSYHQDDNLISSDKPVKRISLMDGNGLPCFLSIWKDKKTAQSHFSKSSENTIEFDLPLFLIK